MARLKILTKPNKKVVIENSVTNNKKKKRSAVNNLKRNYMRFSYTNETLKEAIEKVRSNSLSANKAAAIYKIPKGTLIKKLNENDPEPTLKKMGPPTVLTVSEEEKIKHWILNKARIGFPMHPTSVKKAIQNVLVQVPRPNPFKNNMPGNKWLKLFLKRHPEISLKNTEVLSKSRAAVTDENIRDWFVGLQNHLIAEGATDILEDPSRITNMDETSVQLCPKTGKLLGETAEKNNYFISPGQEKQNITVLCSYRADGKIIRPMIVFPYKRFPPKDVAASVPEGYVIGHSSNGWMTTDTFNTHIKNCFFKQLVQDCVTFPVLLLLDGHSSHFSLEIHEFCKANKIVLYRFHPNATHILQPCDVGIFRPLKRCWQKKVREQSQVSTAAITKANFAPLFHEAFTEASDPATIIKSFECCGLYPFNADKVNYSKCMSHRHKAIKEKSLQQPQLLDTDVHNHNTNSPNNDILQNIELNIPQEILSEFELVYQQNKLPSVEFVLYNMWKKFEDSSESKIIDDCDKTDTLSRTVYQKDGLFYMQDSTLSPDDVTNEVINNISEHKVFFKNLNEENEEVVIDSNSQYLNTGSGKDETVVLAIDDDELSKLLETNNPILIDDANIMNTSIEPLNLSRKTIEPSDTFQDTESLSGLNSNESRCTLDSSTQKLSNSSSETIELDTKVTLPITIEQNVCHEANINKIWEKELHYPEISDSKKKEKI